MKIFFAAAVVLTLLYAPRAYADFYRWVDRDGKEFFTNDLEKVPHEYRSRTTQVKPDESRVTIGDAPKGSTKVVRQNSSEHKDRFGRGEDYWRKRAKALRAKLWDQQADYSRITKQLDEANGSPKKITGKKKKKPSSLEKKKTKLEKDIAKTKRALEVDLPEEARRADAYPGWLRE